jgi:hypothetical protein
VFVLGGCTDDEPDADAPQPGWQTVNFEGVTFDVPEGWAVESPEEWIDFHCLTFRDDGVFLPPPPEDDPYLPSCPATLDYGASVHLYRDDGGLSEDDAVTEGAGDDRRLVASTLANRWRSVTFVERGVRLEFYEIDRPTYEAIVSSVEGSRA